MALNCLYIFVRKLLKCVFHRGARRCAVSSSFLSHTISFGEFCVDLSKNLLYRNDERIRLTPKEFDTLRVLAENSGHLVTKEEIIQEVWRETFIGDTSLTRNISVLRKILGPGVIETVPKRGYLFVARTERSTQSRPCGETEQAGSATEPSDAIPFNSVSELTRNQPPPSRRVEAPTIKVVAIAALVLLVGAAFAGNHR
jgi:DNA-binding winged helix-turn-helix (wHTH) protein